MKCPHPFIQWGFAWRKALPFTQNYDNNHPSANICATSHSAKPEQSAVVAQRKGMQLRLLLCSGSATLGYWLHTIPEGQVTPARAVRPLSCTLLGTLPFLVSAWLLLHVQADQGRQCSQAAAESGHLTPVLSSCCFGLYL